MSDPAKTFTRGMGVDGPFAAGAGTEAARVAIGVIARQSRFGASRVAAIEEVK